MRSRRAAAILGCAVLTALSAAACTPDVTSQRVTTTFGQTFTRLYRLQLTELGRPSPTPLLRLGSGGRVIRQQAYAHARCHKGARHSVQTGAGDNWTCIEFFQRPGGAIAEADYEVSVQTNGCLIATGPAQVIGKPQLQTPAGKTVVNPLSQFDACFST